MCALVCVHKQSPSDAVACFLDAVEDLSLLVLDGVPLRRRPFPLDPVQAVPIQQRSFVSRLLCDALGETRHVEVLVEDEWIQLTDALELEILEHSAGEASVDELIAELAAADTSTIIEEAEVVERLRHLYRLRLICFQ